MDNTRRKLAIGFAVLALAGSPRPSIAGAGQTTNGIDANSEASRSATAICAPVADLIASASSDQNDPPVATGGDPTARGVAHSLLLEAFKRLHRTDGYIGTRMRTEWNDGVANYRSGKFAEAAADFHSVIDQ